MLSIVMPTFNQGRYIRQSIQSVLSQTYRAFELIIVDDASTDDTPQILKELVCGNPHISLLRNETNLGTGRSLNHGFSIAHGEMETWWASDNVMYPNCLETLVGHLRQHPEVDYVYSDCEMRTMDEDGVTPLKINSCSSEVGGQVFTYSRLLCHYYLGVCWAWRQSLRLAAGGLFQPEPCEDYDMVLRMAEAGGRFANIPAELGWFRRHKENMTHKILRDKGHYYSHFVQEKAAVRRAAKGITNGFS